jgi:hypothetical protein
MEAPPLSPDQPAALAWEPEGQWVAFAGGDGWVQIEWVRPEHEYTSKRIAGLATESGVS